MIGRRRLGVLQANSCIAGAGHVIQAMVGLFPYSPLRSRFPAGPGTAARAPEPATLLAVFVADTRHQELTTFGNAAPQ